jgi:4-hydroxythreonine-4-phosphate dehydrogenase
MGDPSGIGPELCLRAFADSTIREGCELLLLGDAAILRRVADATGLSAKYPTLTVAQWHASTDSLSPAIVDFNTPSAELWEPGRVQGPCGRASFDYVSEAIDGCLRGRIDAMVTAPINKESLHLGGFDYPGHTEILAALTNSKRTCMLQTSDEISIGFVTTHCGYAEVPSNLSADRIVETAELTVEALRRIQGREPRLTVCGLNPHAGEHGLFGNEEAACIEPAIERLRGAGIAVEGPLPPDTAFLPAARARTDGYICMYHDQGHIPFKMLAFECGVNVTLGLPIIRTSVDHGTAFDIAWQGVADSSSLFHAIRMAARLCPR